MEPNAVDWEALTAAAVEALQHAYVPYSGYRVGAAALTAEPRAQASRREIWRRPALPRPSGLLAGGLAS